MVHGKALRLICREKAQNAQHRQRQPKELNHGFHGFHGLEVGSAQTILIRAIRAIRGKTFAKQSDPDILQDTLFPRLRWENEASQPACFQQLVIVSTNMLVLVCG